MTLIYIGIGLVVLFWGVIVYSALILGARCDDALERERQSNGFDPRHYG